MRRILDFTLNKYNTRIDVQQETFENELLVTEIHGGLTKQTSEEIFPTRLDVFFMLLVLDGEITIDSYYHSHRLTTRMAFEMQIGNVIERIALSPDFKGHMVMISHSLMSEVLKPLIPYFPANTIGTGLLYPVKELNTSEVDALLCIFHRLQKYIADKNHLYRIQIIKNELSTFILELNNGLRQRHGSEDEEILNNVSIQIREQFIQLLIEHCKKEHEVSFYADKLCVTTDYLSRTVRESSGKSALKWINHAMITEAKILLRKPDMNVQQVAEMMHFSDQSSFGKFFKKHTGMSPLEYRKG